VTGYVAIPARGKAKRSRVFHLGVIPRRLGFAGTRRFRVGLSRAARSKLRQALAGHRTLQARLTLAAVQVGGIHARVSATVPVQLLS
jgi:hypothetical protein